MARPVFSLCLVGVILALSACAVSEEKLKESGATPMTMDEIKALHADKTVNGVNEKGTKWVVYYDPSGKVRGRANWSGGSETDTGIWEATQDDMFCVKYEKWRDASRRCWQVYMVDGKLNYIGKVGDAKSEVDKDTWRQGNPENL